MRSQTRVILGMAVFIVAFAMLVGGSRSTVAVHFGKIPGELAPYTPPAPEPPPAETLEPIAALTTETAALPALPGLDLPAIDIPLPDIDIPPLDDIVLPDASTSETETAETPPAEESAPSAPKTPPPPAVYVADLSKPPMQFDSYRTIENTTYGGLTRTNGKVHALYTADAIPTDTGGKKACPT